MQPSVLEPLGKTDSLGYARSIQFGIQLALDDARSIFICLTMASDVDSSND
jgi:hypothetical protein